MSERTPADHPGKLLLDEFMEREEWTISRFAEALNVYIEDVRDLFSGDRDITPELSQELGVLMGKKPLHWWILQEQWYEARKLRPGTRKRNRLREYGEK